MMLGKIWTRLEVIDKLAEAQGKLCHRLDELEKALGRLDPQAAPGDAKMPDMTMVYDPITKGIKLITMEQYNRHYPKVPSSTYVAMYNPKTQYVDLMFEKQYIEGGHYAKDLKARKPKPVPEMTMVYDEVNQSCRLELWNTYVQKHNPPQSSWAMKYNPKKQSIDLVFWRNYIPGIGYRDLEVNDFF